MKFFSLSLGVDMVCERPSSTEEGKQDAVVSKATVSWWRGRWCRRWWRTEWRQWRRRRVISRYNYYQHCFTGNCGQRWRFFAGGGGGVMIQNLLGLLFPYSWANASFRHPALLQDDSSALLTHPLCWFHRHASQRSAVALFRWLQLGLGTLCNRLVPAETYNFPVLTVIVSYVEPSR